jgi:aconitase A
MIDVRQRLPLPSGGSAAYYSLPQLRKGPLRPRQPALLRIERQNGRRESVTMVVRIDTPIEAADFSAGGILPYVLEQLLGQGVCGGATP